MAGFKPWACTLLLALTAFVPSAWADDDAETRLRTALRSATVELRQLQDQNATLLAKQAQDAREKLELTQKLAADDGEIDTLRQQVKADEELRPKLAAATSAAEAERGNVAKLQASYQELGTAARARDAEATQLDATLVDTRKRLLDCQDKNAELYELGRQALDLYDKKGFFSTLATSEPATGLMRVKLENLVQDMEDKMRDNKVILPRP